MWIGINDVGNSYSAGANASAALNTRIGAVYSDLLAQLAGAGARNVVLLNVPPVDRSPLATGQGSAAAELEAADVAAFNALVADLARRFKSAQPAANVWLYDAHRDFAAALDRPAAFAQTAGLRNTTAYCAAYGK